MEIEDIGEFELDDMFEHASPRSDLQHTIDQILKIDHEEQQKKGALYLLNLKELCGLSQAAVDHIVNETQKVFEYTIGHIKAGVNECISKNGVEELPELANSLLVLKILLKDYSPPISKNLSTGRKWDVWYVIVYFCACVMGHFYICTRHVLYKCDLLPTLDEQSMYFQSEYMKLIGISVMPYRILLKLKLVQRFMIQNFLEISGKRF